MISSIISTIFLISLITTVLSIPNENKKNDNSCSFKIKSLRDKPNYYVDAYGYKRFCNTNKLVSRWVAEKYLIKRKLRPEEVVHHIDGNKLNNNYNNLVVFKNQADHQRHHQTYYNNNGTWHSEIPEYINYKKFPEYASR